MKQDRPWGFYDDADVDPTTPEPWRRPDWAPTFERAEWLAVAALAVALVLALGVCALAAVRR